MSYIVLYKEGFRVVIFTQESSKAVMGAESRNEAFCLSCGPYSMY